MTKVGMNPHDLVNTIFHAVAACGVRLVVALTGVAK